MRFGKAVIAVGLLCVAGCARNEQLACGPALPPIGAVARESPPPGFAPPSFVTPASTDTVAAAVPAATPAAPLPAPTLTAAERRALNPLENRAAVAGR